MEKPEESTADVVKTGSWSTHVAPNENNPTEGKETEGNGAKGEVWGIVGHATMIQSLVPTGFQCSTSLAAQAVDATWDDDDGQRECIHENLLLPGESQCAKLVVQLCVVLWTMQRKPDLGQTRSAISSSSTNQQRKKS